MIRETYNFVNHWKHYSFDDPCKVCLIKPCCRVACEAYRQYWAFQSYKKEYVESKKHKVLIAISIIVSVSAYVLLLIKIASGG